MLKKKEKIVKQTSFVKFDTETKKYNSKFVRFVSLYRYTNFYQKCLVVVSIGILTGFLTLILAEESGIYYGGTGAFCQGIARFTYVILMKNMPENENINIIVFQLLYWGLYLFLNIFLTIFAYKKIGKKFAILSVIYLTSTQLSGFIFGTIFDFLKIDGLLLFGDTSTVDTNLNEYGVKCIFFYTTWFPTLNSNGNFDWTNLQNASNTSETVKSIISSENLTKSMLLFIYSSTYAIITSISYAIVFILGGSTAGSDYITVYLSEKKNKSIGAMFMILNLSFLLMGVSIGTFASASYIRYEYLNWTTFFTPNLLSSALWVLINGVLIDKLFPRSKFISIKAWTNKAYEISEYMRSFNFPGSISIGSRAHTNKIVETTINILCPCIELPKVILAIRKFDEQCAISSYICAIDGEINIERSFV